MRTTSRPCHLYSPTRSRRFLALTVAGCLLLPLTSAPYAEAAPAKATDIPKAVLDMVSASEAHDDARVQSLRAEIDALSAPARGDRRAARKANNRGLEALKREDLDTALAAFTEATAADLADIEVLNNLAHTQSRANRFTEAEQTLLRVLTLAPGHINAWAEFGRVHGARGLKDKAASAFRTAYQFSKNQEKTAEYLKKLADGGWGANATTQEAAGTVLATVALSRGDETDGAVMMLLIVPVDETFDPCGPRRGWQRGAPSTWDGNLTVRNNASENGLSLDTEGRLTEGITPSCWSVTSRVARPSSAHRSPTSVRTGRGTHPPPDRPR